MMRQYYTSAFHFFSHIHLMQFDFTRIIHLPKHDDLMRLCQVASADSTLAHPTSYNSSCTCIVLHTGTSWSFHMVIPHGLPNGITNELRLLASSCSYAHFGIRSTRCYRQPFAEMLRSVTLCHFIMNPPIAAPSQPGHAQSNSRPPALLQR